MVFSDVELRESITVEDWVCESTEEALRSEVWWKTFGILIGDTSNSQARLDTLIKKEVDDYSVNELKWIISLFTWWEVSKKYESLFERFTWNIKNVSIDDLKTYFEKKIFNIWIRIIKNPTELNLDSLTFQKLMNELWFTVSTKKSEENENKVVINLASLSFNGIPFWFGEDWNIQKMNSFPEFEGMTYSHIEKRSSNWKPKYGKISSPKWGEEIPFWTNDSWEYEFFTLSWKLIHYTYQDSSWRPFQGGIELKSSWITVPFWTEKGEYKFFEGVDWYNPEKLCRIRFWFNIWNWREEWIATYITKGNNSAGVNFWKEWNKYVWVTIDGIDDIIWAYSNGKKDDKWRPLEGHFWTSKENESKIRAFKLVEEKFIEVFWVEKAKIATKHITRQFAPPF